MLLKAKISRGGKIAIPSLYKKMLNVTDGDELVFEVKNDQVTISSLKATLKKVRKLIHEKNINNKSLVDQLIAVRRKEGENE